MKFYIIDLCNVFNCSKQTIYPQLKKFNKLFLFNSNKKCKRVYTETEIMAIVPYIKKPKKPFVINKIDNNLIFLATILNNR
jgi:hypothetical protein